MLYGRFFAWIPAVLLAAASFIPVLSQAASNAAFEFERPALLEPKIAFWTRVFGEYSEFQSAIHLMDHPDRIYTVLDFRYMAAEKGPVAARHAQSKAEKKAKNELNEHLKRVHHLRKTPSRMNADEQKVYDMLADGTDPDRYKKAVGRVRAQRGLHEATARALRVSGQYLSRMERVFERESLPVLLTRLPLVESSFNVEAYSKVGAAGLWQFIPSSARIYMRLDEAVDDRRDPWTSTEAAARHLKEDYAALGNWPLAVTAYNHGRAGLAGGLRQVNGDSLEDLIKHWKHRRFGFASQNFYAEFLAAVDVERNHRQHFGEIQRNAPIEFETVETEHYVPYDVLRRTAGLEDAAFRQLNPGYRPEVFDGRLHVPPQSTIRLPPGKAESFKVAYSALGDAERFDQQNSYFVRYRVQRGDTLSAVARRHRVSLGSLMQANGLRQASLLQIGQALRIPPRGGMRSMRMATALATPAATPITVATADAGGYLHHHVTKGQTLFAIARQYRTTIDKLRQMNGLDEKHSLLHAGATIKVPQH